MRKAIGLLAATLIGLASLSAAAPAWAQSALTLVMVEEHGCAWCARWDAEIGVVYAKTDEGRAAPLRRILIHDREPDGVRFARLVNFTPTFVLVRDGAEIGRIEGYPGEDFFWPMLGQLIERARTADAPVQ